MAIQFEDTNTSKKLLCKSDQTSVPTYATKLRRQSKLHKNYIGPQILKTYFALIVSQGSEVYL